MYKNVQFLFLNDLKIKNKKNPITIPFSKNLLNITESGIKINIIKIKISKFVIFFCELYILIFNVFKLIIDPIGIV